MYSLLSVNTVAFTLWDYSMSWIELVGTLFNIWCVWLAVRKNIWTWPVGLVGIILYFFLFYQIHLYSDMGEQIYYFILTFIGWWAWHKEKASTEKTFVLTLSWRKRLGWIVVTIFGTIGLTFVTTHLPTWLPAFFTEPPAYPWIDAATTVVSFVATYLMAKRYLECWMLWILVDVIAIWLYFVQGVKFVSLEYFIFLTMASIGGYTWWKAYSARKQPYEQPS